MKQNTNYDDDTVDMDLVKREWEKDNARMGRFQPKNADDYLIRVLPPTKKGLYFEEFGLHYDVGIIARGAPSDQKATLCLRKTLNQDCPICSAVDGMLNEARMGETEDQATISRALKVRTKLRFVMNICHLDNPKAGVLTWEVGKDAMVMVKSIFNRYGNVAHPGDGRNLVVTYAKKDVWTVVSSILPEDKSELDFKNWRESRKDLEAYVMAYHVKPEDMKRWIRSKPMELDESEAPDVDDDELDFSESTPVKTERDGSIIVDDDGDENEGIEAEVLAKVDPSVRKAPNVQSVLQKLKKSGKIA